MPVKARNHLDARRLIGLDDLTEFFRIELSGEWGRVHQVTKQYGKLAAFGFRATTFGSGDLSQRGVHVLLECWRGSCLSRPDEYFALLVNSEALGGDEFGFRILEEGRPSEIHV